MTQLLSQEEALARLLETIKVSSEQDDKKRKDHNARVAVLMRFITAIDCAANKDISGNEEGLTFNGQRPNNYNQLGHYLVHGGRIFFDLSELDNRDRNSFKNYLMKDAISAGVINRRLVATHEIGEMQFNNKHYFFL